MKDKNLKERIVARYLTSGISYREVADEGGVDYRSLHRWVKEYQGRMRKPLKYRRARLLRELPTDRLPTNVETLQSELRKARLHNQALQEVIHIAEEELGIPILKSLAPSNPESGAKNALPSSWSALLVAWLQQTGVLPTSQSQAAGSPAGGLTHARGIAGSARPKTGGGA